jgi:hypothetical protein
MNETKEEKSGGCTTNETTIFQCGSRNDKIIAVCAKDLGKDGGYLQYRFGTKDKVELSLPADDKRADFKKTIVAGHLMFAHGGGDYLEFSNGGDTTYVVYTAMGSGFDESGVAVMQKGKVLTAFLCADGDEPKMDFSNAQLADANLTTDDPGQLPFELPLRR